MLDSPIPDFPCWGSWHEDGRRYWTTRFGGQAFGVVAVPELNIHIDGPLGRVPTYMMLVLIKPEGWHWARPILEINAATFAETLETCCEVRQNLPVIVAEWSL